MADITWTPEQEAAISAPTNQPAVVSAAAGSGKTALLVERVVRKLRDMNEDIPADRIAIMTFTRNAAEEFRQRMSSAIEKAADSVSSKQERDYLSSQLIKFRGAPIETINAFALRLLKESPDLFGLPYNFSVIEEGKAEILRRRALESVLDDFYSDSYDAAAREQLFKTFSFKNDEELTENIISIYKAVTSLPDRTRLMQGWCGIYTNEDKFCKQFLNDVTEKYDALFNSLVNSVAAMQSYRDSIYSEIQNLTDKDLIKAFSASVKAMDTIIKNDTAALGTFTALYNDAKAKNGIDRVAALLDICFCEADPVDPTKIKKPIVSYPKYPEHKEMFTALRVPIANANTTINKILNPFDLKFPTIKDKHEIPKHPGNIAQSLREDMQRQAVVVNAFLGLVMAFDAEYSRLKLNEGYVDFADCEKLLLEKLSTDDEYRAIMSKRYKCIIIDEFQDTNAIQFEIFRKISDNGKNLFFVGDVKQAIYGFRGGDSSIMARLCNGSEGFTALPLNRNFRSRREVIDSVNAMFCDYMTEEYGDVNYTATGQLVMGANYPNTGTETEDYDAIGEYYAACEQDFSDAEDAPVSVISSDPVSFDKEDYSTEIHILNYEETGNAGYIYEARFTAAKIKELVDNKFMVKDGDGLRPCNYGDFGILLRGKKRFGMYRHELELLGIPVSSERGAGYLDTDEISLIIDLLKIIDNPMLNQETAVVLMSPLYMFSLEEMTKLRLGLMGIDEEKAKQANIDLEPLKSQNAYSSLYHCINSAANGYRIYSPLKCKSPADENHEDNSPEREKYEETIAKLREAGAIYVNSDGETDESLISEGCRKCRRFIADLVKFRAFMANNSVETLIRRIYDDTDYFSLFSIYEDSEQRIANVRLLLRYVADFESSGGGSLSDFLRYTDTLSHNLQNKKTSDVLNSASTSEGKEQSVKLMTFHASKGLEFPICILAELESRFNRSDTSGSIVFHRDLGPAFVDVDIDNLIQTKSYSYHAVSNAEKNKLIGEELRLLYVAMTRAREKLIMIMREKPARLAAYKDTKYDVAITKDNPAKLLLNSLLRGYYGNLPCDSIVFRSGKLLGIKDSRLNIYVSDTPLEEPESAAASKNIERFTADTETVDELTGMITAEYRYSEDTTARSKYVVTEVAHMISSNENTESSQDNHAVVFLKHPTFSDKPVDISGKVVGDAFHHTMEHYPFGADISAAEAIKQLADERKINPTEYDIMTRGIDKVEVFLNSGLCKRMLAAESYNREYEFFAEVPARTIYVDSDGDTAIQGRIDMFFTESDGIVLVDYKSDSRNTILHELPAYKKQLMIYSLILPMMTGKPVKEIYIYSFSLGMEIRVDSLTDEKYRELVSDENWIETLRKEAH
ncbi:MAG: UvrD-helicase domain-containing protein [Oscillospiraceae bacterium]